MTAESADALVRGELLPLLSRMAGWAIEPGAAPPTPRRDLCAACPVAGACAEIYSDRLPARDDPPACAARPRPTAEGGLTSTMPAPTTNDRPTDTVGELEASQLRDRILAELRKDGVTAEAKAVIVGPTVYVIPVSRPRGPVGHLDRAAADVIHRLAAADGVSLEYERTGGRRQFVAKRKHPRAVALAPLLAAKREWLAERPGRFVLGEEPGGDIVTGDLADSATPHLLVAGNSGSGKSVLLKTIVASLVHFHGPAALRLTLLDPKRVTFLAGGFVNALQAHLDSPVLYGLEDAMPCFERFVDVMQERYALFEQAQVSDLHEYNDRVAEGRRLARHVIVMDEFQDITAERKASQAFCGVVARLGAKARAAGVHLVLATQRPDRETVPPSLKANLGGKIALRVSSAVNSRVILDAAGAERLLGKGDLYAELGKGLVRAQAAVT